MKLENAMKKVMAQLSKKIELPYYAVLMVLVIGLLVGVIL